MDSSWRTWVISCLVVIALAVVAIAIFRNREVTTENQPESVTVALGERITLGGVTIEPFAIAEDSRCPVDVQCIQAGTVRVVATSERGPNYTFTLGQPLPIEGKSMTILLEKVTPERHSGVSIKKEEYRFTFITTQM